MNTHKMTFGILLLSLLLVLGGCYSLQKIPPARLNEEKTHRDHQYWIGGAYLEDGTYLPFEKDNESFRADYKLGESFRGAFWTPDSLYGVSAFWEAVYVSVDRVKSYAYWTDGQGYTWIKAVHLKDGNTITFALRDPGSVNYKNLPSTYRLPIIVGNTLHGYTYSHQSMAIPVEEIEKYQVHRVDVVASVFFPAALIGGIVLGVKNVIANGLENIFE